MPKTCSICLENVNRPAKLDLNCQCKYSVHYKCFNNWWKDNKKCIICHEICYKPNNYKRNRTPIRRNIVIKKGRRLLPRRIYPTNNRYIHDYLNKLPFDNENKFKNIIFVFFIFLLCSYYYYKRFQLL